MTVERMSEIFGISHAPDKKCICVGEEEVLVPHGPAIVVLSEEEEVMCTWGPIVMIDDEGHVPPLVSSSHLLFLKNT
jgi:hypothetical protein